MILFIFCVNLKDIRYRIKMYSHGILKDDEMRDIKNDYIWNKENDKERDKR